MDLKTVVCILTLSVIARVSGIRYSVEVGAAMAKFAAQAYCSEEESNVTQKDLIATFSDESSGAVGYVAIDSNPQPWDVSQLTSAVGTEDVEALLVVSFGGTDIRKLSNIITDLEIWESAEEPDFLCSGAFVHSGFLRAWESVSDAVLEGVQQGLEQWKAKNKGGIALVITGHSLGGSVATLAAATLSSVGYTPSLLVTFGSPRTGNKEFTDCLNTYIKDTSFRITHHRDPIVHLPLSCWGYSHIAAEIFYPNIHDSIWMECESDVSNKEDPKCSAQYGNLGIDAAFFPDHWYYGEVDFLHNWLHCAGFEKGMSGAALG